eukprot:4606558-Karenia_brevis.AAC.1
MEGKQTVPRSEMTAVMRALQQLSSMANGLLQSPSDWDEIWDKAEAIIARGTTVQIKKVKAHTTDEAIASKGQQAWNWLVD